MFYLLTRNFSLPMCMVRKKEELTMGERSLWDSRASLSRLSCSTSSWAWVMAGFSQHCTSRPASCSRASRAAPFTWLTWCEEEEIISWLAVSTLCFPLFLHHSGGGLDEEAGFQWLLGQGWGSPVPSGCSPALPVAAVPSLGLLALEPADASVPVAAGPGEDGRGGWRCCGP